MRNAVSTAKACFLDAIAASAEGFAYEHFELAPVHGAQAVQPGLCVEQLLAFAAGDVGEQGAYERHLRPQSRRVATQVWCSAFADGSTPGRASPSRWPAFRSTAR